MKYFYITDAGTIRDHNEDSVTIVENSHGEYLLAVADGMGGHRAGEVASNIVINHLTDRFLKNEQIGDKEEAINWIKTTVSEANELIIKHTQDYPESTGMGTTIVVALYSKDYLLFGNLGDSSGFVVKNHELHKITNDHTLVNLLVKSGELTEEEAKDHPRKNVLMKALGATTSIEMDIFVVETDVDGILLCSDGLTNMLEQDQIMKVLDTGSSVEEKLNKLVIKSNNRGGTDNISIAYLTKDGE